MHYFHYRETFGAQKKTEQSKDGLQKSSGMRTMPSSGSSEQLLRRVPIVKRRGLCIGQPKCNGDKSHGFCSALTPIGLGVSWLEVLISVCHSYIGKYFSRIQRKK